MLFLFLSAAGCYLYFLTNRAISIDNISGDRYYFKNWLQQGRLTTSVFNFLFKMEGNADFIKGFIGVVMLCVAAIIFCVLFDRFAPDKSNFSRYIFSCLLVTAPIYVELFAYDTCALIIGAGMAMMATALFFVVKNRDTKKFRYIPYATILIAIVTSWYESLIVVYFGAVFALLLLEFITTEVKPKLMRVIFEGMRFAVPFGAGVVLEYVIQRIVFVVFDIQRAGNAKNSIGILSASFKSAVHLALNIVKRFFLSGLWYIPITILAITIVIGIALCIYYCIRRRSLIPVILFGGLYVSLIALSVLKWDVAAYRMCQIFAFFSAFIIYLLIHTVNRFKGKLSIPVKKLVAICAIYLVFLQVSESNYWYYWEVQRYEEEKTVMTQVSSQLLQEYDISKPVVFVGVYTFSDNLLSKTHIAKDSFEYRLTKKVEDITGLELIADAKVNYSRKIPVNIVSSYINWGMKAFGEPNTELFKFLNYHGIDYLKQGDRNMFLQASKVAKKIPRWPAEGSIVDAGEFIIVRF